MRKKRQGTLTIDSDASPLLSYLEFLTQRAIQLRAQGIDLPHMPAEFFRLEVDDSAAGTGKLFVRFYPSDALLRFASALTLERESVSVE